MFILLPSVDRYFCVVYMIPCITQVMSVIAGFWGDSRGVGDIDKDQ